MAIQAISKEPLPVGNQIEIIHTWEINGDARVVRLIQTSANRLMCQVFNRATDEFTHRIIQFKSNNEFASLSAYAGYISANMHPVLGSNRHGPTCTAMLVQNSSQLVHAWYSGLNGEVEVKLFYRPELLKRFCIALDTSSNNQKIFSLTKDIKAENARQYEPLITHDADGSLNTLDFQIVRQTAPSPLLEPTLRQLPPWDSPAWVVVREWDLGNDKKVRLCRFEDNFCSKYAHSGDFTQAKVTHMPIPSDMSADEVFADISTMHPSINSEGSVKYLIAEKSRLNDGVIIDEENWGVTLVDLGHSGCDVETAIGIGKCKGVFDGKIKSTFSWGGHAVIVIEKIADDGHYQAWRADALPGEEGQLVPRLFKEDHLERLEGNFPRSITWIRAKNLVQQMISSIEGRVDLHRRGHSLDKFSALMSAKGPYSNDRTYNCIEWCKEPMSLASIKVPSPYSSIFLSTPIASMRSKRGIIQEVATQVVTAGAGGFGSGFFWAVVGSVIGGPPGAAIGASVGCIGGATSILIGANVHNAGESDGKLAQQRI